MSTSVQARRSTHLGGLHIHKLFGLNGNNNSSPQRMAELALIRLSRTPEKENLLKTTNQLFLDEAGTVSAELLSIMDMILRRLRDNSIPFGGVHIICTMDHTQLAPVTGKPFLVSSHILSCFKMVRLQHSVRATSDPQFQRLQQIVRMHPDEYIRDSSILEEFKNLAGEVFTFVPD